MSERHSVGDYNLEISGRELVVRDHGGAVVETIDLANVAGAFSLPDGQMVDVASLILSEEPDIADFETAAGPANENDPNATMDSPASFRAFVGDDGDFASRGAAGALDNTSLAYGGIDDEPAPNDLSLFGEDAPTIPVNWSRHDEWRIPENQAGGDFGPLVYGDARNFTFDVSDTRFEVADGILQLKDGVSFDFESESFIDIDITATSKTGETKTQSIRIDVIDENEGQTGIDLDNATVVENAAGAVIGNLTIHDPDSGDSQSLALSDDRFEVVGGQLKLKDGISLDFETEPSVNVTVTATDKGGNSISQQFTVVVGDANEAQSALSLDGAYVAENAAGAVIGALTVTDPDAGDSQTFMVSDSRFEVVNGQLKLKDGVALDFEAEPTVNVTVTATDKGGHSIAEQFTLGVADVNEAPLSLTLATDSAQLLLNGSFEADKLNNGQWKLFGGIEGWNTSTQVEIQNNVTNKASNGAQVVELDADKAVDNLYQDVKTTAGHVYELSFDTSTRKDTKHTDTIEVYWNGVKVGAVDPQSTAWQTSTFHVVGTGGDDRLEFREVGGKNDSYGGLLDNVSLKGMGNAVPENFAGAVVGHLHVTDPDAGDSHGFAVSDSRFEVVAGDLKLKDGISFNYEAEQSVDVTVTATDTGGNAIQQTFTINVVDVNEAPVVAATNGSVESHIIDTNTAYGPSANAAIGAYLYSNDSSKVAKPNSNLLNGVAESNMTLTAPAEVTVTFQKEAAGNRNMVGTYQYDDQGNIIPDSVKFVWLDATASTEGKLGASMAKDFLGYTQSNTVSLGTMDAGTHVGFFTISNGASNNANKALLTAAAAGAASQAAAMEAIAEQLSIEIDPSGNGHVYVGGSQMSGDVFFSHDKSLNTDFSGGSDIDHMASGVNANLTGQLVIGVEDLKGGGDRDYNDVVFSLNLGSYDVDKTTQTIMQPSVDFSDVDSSSLSQAIIRTTGFQAGDSLNIPASGVFNVTVSHASNDYTITIAGKTGGESVDQYESFVNSIQFSTTSTVEGDRQIAYNIVDEGGLTSNIASAKVGVATSYEVSSSEISASQHELGSGNDHFHLNGSLKGNVDFGDGYDTLHLARVNEGLSTSEKNLLDSVEAIDSTGYGTNNVALSITDVLDLTDNSLHLTVIGDKGDVVTLSGDSSGHHWSVAETGADFTTYVWSDPVHQAVVEISNQLTATLSI